MFQFTEDQQNKIAELLSELMLKVGSMKHATPMDILVEETKTIVAIEDLINYKHTSDPNQMVLPIQ